MSCMSSKPAWAHQVTDAFLQRGGDLLERQVQLQLLLALFGLLAESADRVLAVDLILSLHSDSPFSEKQKLLRAYRPGAESRYFLRTIGHPPAYDAALQSSTQQIENSFGVVVADEQAEQK